MTVILFTDSPSPPNRTIGAYRIATALRRKNIEVEVIDFLSHWNYETLIEYLNSIKDIEWIGFSTKFYPPGQRSKRYLTDRPDRENSELGYMTQMPLKAECNLLQYIRNRNIQIVVGGPNAELIRHYTDNIDIVCLGYSDIGVISVHNHIVSNMDLIFDKVDNIKIIDCDKSYPVDDLTQLDTEYVHSDFIQGDEVFPIEISRGCIFHCAFCEFGHLGKKSGTYIRPKDSIKKDILDRYDRYGSSRFLFVDDTFNDSIEKMHIIRDIREETGINFEFWSYCRLDLLSAKPEMVNLIPKIGWKSLTFGIETFNRDSGRSVGKGADPEKLKNLLLELRERFPTIKMQVNIIAGLPHDTEESVRDTVQWFIDNPEITHLVKVTALSMRNPEGRKTASKISLDPEKYGYKITSSKKFGPIIWKSKSMDTKFALQLADELQKKIRDNLISVTDNRDSITTMHNLPVSIVNDGEVINTQMYKIDNYIKQKQLSRNISI